MACLHQPFALVAHLLRSDASDADGAAASTGRAFRHVASVRLQICGGVSVSAGPGPPHWCRRMRSLTRLSRGLYARAGLSQLRANRF